MTLEKLISDQEKIDKSVEQLGIENDLDVAFDGAISPKDYLNSNYKTIWIFKEPSEESGMHGSDYKKAILESLEKPKFKSIFSFLDLKSFSLLAISCFIFSIAEIAARDFPTPIS